MRSKILQDALHRWKNRTDPPQKQRNESDEIKGGRMKVEFQHITNGYGFALMKLKEATFTGVALVIYRWMWIFKREKQ